MRKNPDGSKVFNDVVNSGKVMDKIQELVNKQNFYLANTQVEDRMEHLDVLRKETMDLYKKIIIGTSLESDVIEVTNRNHTEMSKFQNRSKDKNKFLENKEKIDYKMYAKLATTPFGDENNIVRCELNRQEEFSDVETQKCSLWSNKIAHFIENDSLRYMTDFGYGRMNLNSSNISDRDRSSQKMAEKKFLSNMRSAYKRYTDEDKYKFSIEEAFLTLSDEEIDINSTSNQNIINLKKLMNVSGFSRSSNNKDAMRSFVHCMNDQRQKDYFFNLKQNFAQQLLLELKEKEGDNVLKAYYVKDHAIKDNKGRGTIRLVVINENEGNNYLENNDCYFVSRAWKESTRFEKADEIISNVGENITKANVDKSIDDVLKKECSGKEMSKSEIMALCNILSASIYHLPEEEILDFCRENGIKFEEAKNLTEKSIAFAGSTSVEVGFGSKSIDEPYENLPRYQALSYEVENVKQRSKKLTKKKKMMEKESKNNVSK